MPTTYTVAQRPCTEPGAAALAPASLPSGPAVWCIRAGRELPRRSTRPDETGDSRWTRGRRSDVLGLLHGRVPGVAGLAPPPGTDRPAPGPPVAAHEPVQVEHPVEVV